MDTNDSLNVDNNLEKVVQAPSFKNVLDWSSSRG